MGKEFQGNYFFSVKANLMPYLYLPIGLAGFYLWWLVYVRLSSVSSWLTYKRQFSGNCDKRS
ncbi:hypothetical protein BuS5_00392 [Desulfosarcina sp. BuS5]|nr:hypothetical protein BuS5_00392 [Desulfosarcina sp. BuS5]